MTEENQDRCHYCEEPIEPGAEGADGLVCKMCVEKRDALGTLKLGERCYGKLGVDEDGRRVIACSFCDLGCDGSMIAPNAAIVCSEACREAYDKKRFAEVERLREMPFPGNIREVLTPKRMAEICDRHLDTLDRRIVMRTFEKYPERLVAFLNDAGGTTAFKTELDVARWLLRQAHAARRGGDA